MKPLEDILAANAAIPRPFFPDTGKRQRDQVLSALKTALASLQDVLRYGAGQMQRKNIRVVDLPILEEAITVLERDEGGR